MFRKERFLSLLAGGLVLFGSSTLLAVPGERPADSLRRIESKDPDRHFSLWVAASEATQHGYVKWEEFSRGGRDVIQAMIDMGNRARDNHKLDMPRDGCASWTRQGKRHRYIPNKTLKELAGNFTAIFRGRVVAKAEGFIDGWPGTLYEVDVESSSQPSPASIYVYYPLARIEAEGVVLCHQGDRFPDQPAIGRQILVFAEAPDSETPLILSPQDEELFFERADGTLSLPSHYGEADGEIALEDLEREAVRLTQSVSREYPKSGVER